MMHSGLPSPSPDEPDIDLSAERLTPPGGATQTTGSIGGGVSLLHAREKFTGVYGAEVTLDDLKRSFESRGGPSPGAGIFRTSARLVAPTADLAELSDEVTRFQRANPSIPLELEYHYAAGPLLSIVGLGITGAGRYQHERYAPILATLASARSPTYGELSLLQTHARGRGPLHVDESLEVVGSVAELTAPQEQELHLLLSSTFGEYWTLDALRDHDPLHSPMRIGIDSKTEAVRGVALAEADAHTVEVTEWAAVQGGRGAGARVMRDLVRFLLVAPDFAEKTIFGEFNLASPAARQAFRLGFEIPPLRGVPAPMVAPANVKVKGKLCDFAVLTFPEGGGGGRSLH